MLVLMHVIFTVCYFPLIFVIIVSGHLDIVQMLLGRSVDVRWKSKSGVNALIGKLQRFPLYLCF